MPKEITTYTERSLTSVSSSLTSRGREELAVSGYDVLEFPEDRQVGWIDIPSLDLSFPAKGSVRIPRLPSVITGTDLEQFAELSRRVEFTPSLGSKGDLRFLQDFPPNAITSLKIPLGFASCFDGNSKLLLSLFNCYAFAISQYDWNRLDDLINIIATCPNIQCVVFLTSEDEVGWNDSLRYRDPRIRPLLYSDLISWNKAPAYIYLGASPQELFPHPTHIYVDSSTWNPDVHETYSPTDIQYLEFGACYREKEGNCLLSGNDCPKEIIDWIFSRHPNLKKLTISASVSTPHVWSLIADSSIEELVIHGELPQIESLSVFPPTLKTFSCGNDFPVSFELAIYCSHPIKNLRFTNADAARTTEAIETILATPSLERLEFAVYDDTDLVDVELPQSLSLKHLAITTSIHWDGASYWIDGYHGLRGFDFLNAVLASSPLESLSLDDVCFWETPDTFSPTLSPSSLLRLRDLRSLQLEFDQDCYHDCATCCPSGYLEVLEEYQNISALCLSVASDITDKECEDLEVYLEEIVCLSRLRSLDLDFFSRAGRGVVKVDNQAPSIALAYFDALSLCQGLTDCRVSVAIDEERLPDADATASIITGVFIDFSTLLDPVVFKSRLIAQVFGEDGDQ